MRERFYHFFIPYEGNGFRPHSLRGESAIMFSIIAVLLFAGALLHTRLLTRTNLFAAIVPEVLADYANDERAALFASRLRWSPALADAAAAKARDMAEKGYFAHTSPEGITPWYWFLKSGYQYRYAGENLAVYFSDSVDVHTAWMNSPGHRANIVNNDFTEIGVATARGVYEGRETVFVVELFATPQESAAAVLGNAAGNSAPARAKKTAPTVSPPERPAAVAGTETKNELFAASEREEGAGVAPALASEDTSTNSQSVVALFRRAASSPRTNLRLAYLALFGIIGFALFAGVFAEIRRHHPLHSLYGASLIALLALFYYAGETYLFSQVRIV